MMHPWSAVKSGSCLDLRRLIEQRGDFLGIELIHIETDDADALGRILGTVHRDMIQRGQSRQATGT